ncbi:probable sugar phosphate/phosphate translocator At3g11320 isoform X1 [Rosa rugosa]|uniref:probable sugar phosphate/phosphate translocator At3g11320 isoform X1 n=2 Tax=Rosa rugosa TaxID=74645 RepID=UPI002B40DD73|nr:probable sugar phosphate/phosphate translocator At3g11320 isoform X1 [Rosa rugosa]
MAQIAILSASASLIPFNSGGCGGGAKQLSKSLQLFSSRRYTTSTTTSSPSLTTIRFRSKRIGKFDFWARAAASHGRLGEVDEWTLPDNKPSDSDPAPPAMKGKSRLFTIGLVTSWYSSNIGVLLLNKYLLSNYGFKYPIFLTMCHMTACSLLSYIAIAWMKMVPMQTIRSRVQFLKITALSLVFCVSVVFGNISLRYLPVSFNQAIGATTPFFTAVFAYFMTLKREAWLTYLTLVPVVTGVIIASGGEPSFHLFGFLICIAATAARALKSVLQGILLSSEGEKLNSMNLLLYMAPIAVVFLLPATLIMEDNVVGITLALARDDVKIIWYLLFNSALAYFVNLTNFLVTKHTSALTLQVLGNAKGAVAVVVSILIFRNPVSVTGMMGYSLTVFGVILYSEAKKRSK